MMKLNKEIEFQKKVFGGEGVKLPVSLLDENNEVLVTTIGFDDFEKLMEEMGNMEKEIEHAYGSSEYGVRFVMQGFVFKQGSDVNEGEN